MKVLIIGGVAGGATAAARARRVSESAEITVIEREPYVSCASCGLPYYISGDIAKRSKLLLQTPEGFDSRYGIKVLVGTEALEIDRKGRRVRVRGPEGESWLPYDVLILSQGGTPVVPPIPGVDSSNVFRLWKVADMDQIHQFVEKETPASAVIAGGGFVGIEMAEAFAKRGISTTIVELLPQVMSSMDPEFGGMVAKRLEAHGVTVRTGIGLKAIHPDPREVELADGTRVAADIVLVSVGVRPEVGLARAAGLTIGASGGLVVDEHMRTPEDPAILAVGDMVEILHKVSGKRTRVPLAGPANRQGRIAASNALGMSMAYRGALGSSVVKVFDATAACTGLTETAARAAGFETGAAVVVKDHHAGYFPGAKELILKLVYDRSNARLLGAQAFGEEGVEKRIDALAVALHGQMTLQDLAEIDLAYSPPYSSANDPINLAAFVGLNDLSGFSPLVTAPQVRSALASGKAGPLILDVRNLNEYESSHIRGALHIPLDDLRFALAEVPRDRPLVVHCRSGFRSHLAVRILKENGWKDVKNLTGGYLMVQAHGGFDIEQ